MQPTFDPASLRATAAIQRERAQQLRNDALGYHSLAKEAEHSPQFPTEPDFMYTCAAECRAKAEQAEAQALALEAEALRPTTPRAKIVQSVDVESHGVDNSQYFQGAGVSFTEFDDCATGVGNSEREALEDALESLAQSGEWAFRPELGFPPEPDPSDYSERDEVAETLADYAPRIPAPVFELVRLPPDGSGPYALGEPTESLAEAFDNLRRRVASFARKGFAIVALSERSEPAIRPDSDPAALEFNSDGDVRAFELQSPEDGSGGDYLLLRLANLREREEAEALRERADEECELHYFVTVRVAQAPEGKARPDGLTEYEDSDGTEWAFALDSESATIAAESAALPAFLN